MVLGISPGSMKLVDWPISPLEASMNVMPASSKTFLSSIGFFRYFNGIPVRLDALESQGGDSFDCPNDVVLSAPDGAGGPEKNVRIDGVERPARSRTPRLGWPHHACSSR